MKTLKFSLQIIAVLLIGSAVTFFFLPEPMQNVDYLQGKLYHYSGESVITTDQFVEMALAEDYDFYFDSYESHGEGFVLVEYDTYSEAELPFLEKLPYDTGDMPTFYDWSLNWVFTIVVLLVVAALCFIVILWMKYLGGYFGSPKADKFFGAVLYKCLRFRDRLGGEKGVEDAKVVGKAAVDAKSIKGIVAVRTWGIFWGDRLKSVGRGTAWESKTLIADKIPTKDNMNGVYAHRAGAASLTKQIVGLVFGIVDMTGKFEYHSNGVVRAERGEILLLVCNQGWYNKGRKISAKYGIPICFAKDTAEAYHSWLFGDNGKECLEHNYQLLEGRRK